MARTSIERAGRQLFVLDTNVLMHDPTALYRFQEHDIFLPMVVLEELDAGKKGMSETARNVRQVSRFLDEIMASSSKADIDAGLKLPTPHSSAGAAVASEAAPGRLFFQTEALPSLLPDSLPGNKPDNNILGTTLALQKQKPECKVTLVSKDINLRIKASVLGIHAEDYYNDKVLDDVDLLFTGVDALPPAFWDEHSKDMESWQEEGRTFYRVRGPKVANWYPNQCLFVEAEGGLEVLVREVDADGALIE
ncbi:MAG: PIN domain-containing protein, partial [Gammaproteobacteria bacterium]